MNKTQALAAFDEYVSHYDPQNPMIALKIAHTYRVASLAERIAKSLEQGEEISDFAWLLGLLHDIGRFEQVRQYGTFMDAKSVDHAEFGADLLFSDHLIDRFPAESLPEGWLQITETAIRLHNKLNLPDDLDGLTLTMAKILRDADKIDIFRVVSELPYEQRIGSSRGMLSETDQVTPEVWDCVMGHRCVPRNVRRTVFDGYVGHCCMAFELEFEESRKIAARQGYLLMLLQEKGADGQAQKDGSEFLTGAGRAARLETLDIVRTEIEKSWGIPLSTDN